MKIILLLIAVMLLITGAEARYSPGLEIAEGANITLDGGYIHKFQGSGIWNPVAYGAIPNDGLDDAKAIQDAMDAAFAAGGGVVILPPGTCDLATSQSDYYNSTILEPRDNVTLIGFGKGVSILRLTDDYRTAYRGGCILADLSGTGTEDFNYTHDWGVRDVTFDGNGQNNLIATNTSWYDNTSRGAGIFAHYAGNVTIENVEFVNFTAFNTVLLGKYGDTGVGESFSRMSSDDKVVNCDFITMGNDISGNSIYDHSTVYIASKNSSVEDCHFLVGSECLDTNMCAIEIHAPGDLASGNLIQNYRNGIYAASENSYTGEGVNQRITDNTIRAGTKGIDVWGLGGVFNSIVITGNDIEVSLTSPGDSSEFAISHGFIWNDALQDPTANLFIDGNRIRFTGYNYSSFATGIEVWRSINTSIRNNYIEMATCKGITWNGYSETDAMIDITGNDIRYFGTSTAVGYYLAGIHVYQYGAGGGATGNIKHCDVLNNNLLFDKTLPGMGDATGIGIDGESDANINATVRYNTISGGISWPVDVGYYGFGTSDVLVEYYDTAAPEWGECAKGSIVWNSAPAAAQPMGWVCTTAGNGEGNPGTWKAMANLAT